MGNDSKDRHVLAAAVHSDCEVIVTFDASGFSSNALAPHHLVAVHPDEFLLDQLDLYPGLVRRALERQAAATARPHLTTLDLMDHLNQIGLHGFAAQLRRRWPDMAR